MTMFRVGPAGIPGSIKTDMNNVLNKKFGTTAQDYPPTDWPADVNLLGELEVKTASGAIANITDGADGVPVKNWLVTLPASLDGYTEVNAVRSGKNLLNGEDAVKTANNIRFYYSTGKYYLAGTYTLSISESVSGLYVRNVSTSTNIATKYNSNFITFTLTEKTLIGFDVYKVGINQNDNIMLEYGSTAHAYEPYTAPTQYTASLGRTIYGGTADIVTGEGEDENGNDFTFTPITPTPETALGVNNFWADEGDSYVDYRSSGTVTTITPTLVTKSITDNGTYNAADDNADGFSQVTVNVEGDEDMNYSTTEHEVGTWIDGSTIYERTFELESQLTVSYSAWTSTGISGIGIAKIMGVELFGVSNYQGGGLANIQSDIIMLQTTRNSDAYVKEFSLRYTKSS